MYDRIRSRYCRFALLATATTRALSLILLIALALGSAEKILAQSTFGSVRGIAQDSSGALLPDTQLTLHSLDENTDRKVKSDTDGNFTFENVKAGSYSLQADFDGFAATVINGVTVAARQDIGLSVVMTVAAQTPTMHGTAAAAHSVNTEDATLRGWTADIPS